MTQQLRRLYAPTNLPMAATFLLLCMVVVLSSFLSVVESFSPTVEVMSKKTKIMNNNHRHPSSFAITTTSKTMASSSSSSTTTTATSDIATIEEINNFATSNGISLIFTTRGPGYRCVGVDANSNNSTTTIVGYVEGFIRPGRKILHADKMEIFIKGGGGTFLGPGLLIAYACFLHGKESGCTTAEFLAIDDAEYQHKRLVRYYKMMGFREVRYVGEEIKHIPDRLVWGGCGTLMTEEIDVILKKWTRIIRKV